MTTKEEVKKFLPIMKAYTEGKQIQYLFDDEGWRDIKNPQFTDHSSKYRIKPETKYRKFNSIKECWEEMQKHQPFGWVKHAYKPKNEDRYYSINRIDDETDFNYYFNIFLFADGTPFGIKEEE